MLTLVTGGCSFTAGDKTWPLPLSVLTKSTLYNVGIGSASNETISRRVIWQIEILLSQGIDVENILVGVMWSGYTRQSFYFNHKKEYYKKIGKIINRTTGNENPINPNTWPQNDKEGAWCLATPGMDSSFINYYYKMYCNNVQSLIHSYESVLKLQWYLKLKNIKYFFTGYMSHWNDDNFEHLQTDYLKNMIDYEHFILDTEYEWLLNNSKHQWRNNYMNDHHPSVEQHKQYTEEVILPFIKAKSLI